MNGLPATPMTSRALGEFLSGVAASPLAVLRVTGLCLDSRQLAPGEAFVALRGERQDGYAFIADAIARGAAAILVDAAEAGDMTDPGVPLVRIDGLRARLGAIAAEFHDHPSQALGIVGVTGTNGKTTCTQLLAQAFSRLGEPCGVIGTLGWGFPGALGRTLHTTPDALSVQRLLAGLHASGARKVAMEVSSHALRQGRVDAVAFDGAVFTNLTHDHLDYHGTLEDYGASKALLFRAASLRHAVINVDDAFGRQLLRGPGVRGGALGYGLEAADADVRAFDARYAADGVRARLATPWGSGDLHAPLLGAFNLSNVLAVLTVLCAHGHALDAVLAVLPHLQPVSGRMERIELPGAPLVVVDYAHTPDALAQSLRALRAHCAGRLWCVFGCGGDRDRAKRPLMGRIAWEHADELVITSDNPRSEVAARIIDEICGGVPDPAVHRDTDRAAAIAAAIAAARPGDCVLIAGKGHEDYQEVAGVRTPFSDAACARAALAARGASA